jgi:predicted amidohydrolase YtcJ
VRVATASPELPCLTPRTSCCELAGSTRYPTTKRCSRRGADEAIDAPSAIRLYTSGSAALVGDGDVRGRILPGHDADLVACRVDPLTADVDALPGTAPAFTLVGGHPAHDPDGRFRSTTG